MKRDELKALFEEEFKDIKVSNKLKTKTLKQIEKSNNISIPHIPYLRNICAVFVVTLICFCVYMNKDSFYLDLGKKSEDIVVENEAKSLEQSIGNTENLSAGQMLKTKSFSKEGSYKNEIPESRVLLDETVNDSIQYEFGSATEYASSSVLTEDEFIKNYPEAKKIDIGYKIIEDGIEKIYIFENGILFEILEN